jgi:hypothetical protein
MKTGRIYEMNGENGKIADLDPDLSGRSGFFSRWIQLSVNS